MFILVTVRTRKAKKSSFSFSFGAFIVKNGIRIVTIKTSHKLHTSKLCYTDNSCTKNQVMLDSRKQCFK